jgi:hypothetical protein
MMLYDCYYYCHFCPNIIAFCSIKLDFFLKVTRIRHQNHYNQLKYRYILHLRINEILPNKKTILMNDLFYLEILFC